MDDDSYDIFVLQDYRNCFSRDGSNFSSTPSSYNSSEFLNAVDSQSSSNPSITIPSTVIHEIAKRAVHGDDCPELSRSFSPPGISIPGRKHRYNSPESAPCSAHNSPGRGLLFGQASPKNHNRLTISRSNSIPGVGSQSSLYGETSLLNQFFITCDEGCQWDLRCSESHSNSFTHEIMSLGSV